MFQFCKENLTMCVSICIGQFQLMLTWLTSYGVSFQESTDIDEEEEEEEKVSGVLMTDP